MQYLMGLAGSADIPVGLAPSLPDADRNVGAPSGSWGMGLSAGRCGGKAASGLSGLPIWSADIPVGLAPSLPDADRNVGAPSGSWGMGLSAGRCAETLVSDLSGL